MSKNQPLNTLTPSLSEQHEFMPYGRQTIEDDDIEAVCDVLKSDFLTTGPQIAAFEEKLCEVAGAKHAIAVGNGTQALHLACLATGLGPGTCAIVPSITFLATANAVRYCGADVLFCDVDPDTGLLCLNHFQTLLKEHADKNIRAVLPVHLAGQTVDLRELQDLCSTRDIKIIADSCHAIGTTYGDYSVGACAFEDMATFSFHPVKTIAMGEGGAITTNDQEIAEMLRKARSHGMEKPDNAAPWVYEMRDIGFNYRVTDLQCALGSSQLSKLERFIEQRRALARHYDALLEPLAPLVRLPQRVQNCDPAWHLYAPRFDFEAIGQDRAQIMNALRAENIGSQVHYIPVHTQPYYEDLYDSQNLPGALHYYERTLSLPLYPSMTLRDVQYVVDTLTSIVRP